MEGPLHGPSGILFVVNRRASTVLFALLAVVLITAADPASARQDKPTKRQQRKLAEARQAAIVTAVSTELQAAIDALGAGGDVQAAWSRIDALFDRALSFVPASEQVLFRELAFARRLVRRLAKAPDQASPELIAFLLENPHFARSLVFAIHPEHDDPKKVFALVDRMRRARGDRLDAFATLAAAICVVHDEPKPMRVNENTARSPDPIAIFDFYAANEQRMLFGIRALPTELLVYVVDASASIPEMAWALDRYAGDTNVGRRFFDIDYDYDHLTKGAKKDVTQAGWNLPNILEHGGICADQAYFAVTVGKSIGVPATYTVGKSARSAHAWVGFLQADRKRAWWNFDSGRYQDYQNARGLVEDPQTRRPTPDSTVSLLAAHVSSSVADREYAAAMTDAAARLAEARNGGAFDATPLVDTEGPPLRTPTMDHALKLLEAGLRESPGYVHGWLLLESLSAADDFTSANRRAWGTFLHRLCGRQYQDFYLQIVSGMIVSIDDPQQQDALWSTAFDTFKNRPDLAASVRLAQGRMWLRHGQIERAGRCFEDVIVRFANAGPFVVDALNHAAVMLRTQRDGRRLLALYERTWQQTRRPEEAWSRQFGRQSNWYRVGDGYAKVLDEAGLHADAARVRAELGKMIR